MLCKYYRPLLFKPRKLISNKHLLNTQKTRFVFCFCVCFFRSRIFCLICLYQTLLKYNWQSVYILDVQCDVLNQICIETWLNQFIYLLPNNLYVLGERGGTDKVFKKSISKPQGFILLSLMAIKFDSHSFCIHEAVNFVKKSIVLLPTGNWHSSLYSLSMIV